MLFADLWLLITLGFVTGTTLATGIIIYADCKLRTKNNTGWPGMFTTPYVLLATSCFLIFICHMHVTRIYESILKAIA